jgi:hypothetical protein
MDQGKCRKDSVLQDIESRFRVFDTASGEQTRAVPYDVRCWLSAAICKGPRFGRNGVWRTSPERCGSCRSPLFCLRAGFIVAHLRMRPHNN